MCPSTIDSQTDNLKKEERSDHAITQTESLGNLSEQDTMDIVYGTMLHVGYVTSRGGENNAHGV